MLEEDNDEALDEALELPGGDNLDAFNDDTFGDDVATGGDWTVNNTNLAELHQKFLSERAGTTGNFFDMGGCGFEGEGTGLGYGLSALDVPSPGLRSMEEEADGTGGFALPYDEAVLEMGAHLTSMLDADSPRRHPAVGPPAGASGLLVSGLPASLSEEQVVGALLLALSQSCTSELARYYHHEILSCPRTSATIFTITGTRTRVAVEVGHR